MKSSKNRKDELIARIQAAGIPIVAASETDRRPQLTIYQDFGAYDSTIFNVNAGTGLILPLSVIPNISVFQFSGFAIRLTNWPSPLFKLLEENSRSEWPAYEFHGRSELKFARIEVINGIIADRKELRSGHRVRGLLLAFSHLPMPNRLAMGDVEQGSITIYDQWEHAHSEKIALRVIREKECNRDFGSSPMRKIRTRDLLALEDGK